jgi:hypothetical protein
MKLSRRTSLWLTLAICAIFFALNSQAQIPDKFTNLKELPKDIEKRALVDQMKGYTRALGVRCIHCHVGTGDDLSTYNFSADDKEEKRIARRMIAMVREINEDYVAKLESRTPEQPRVSCWTCHRGEKLPPAVAPPREKPAAPPAETPKPS